jgi:hypothetical protein
MDLTPQQKRERHRLAVERSRRNLRWLRFAGVPVDGLIDNDPISVAERSLAFVARCGGPDARNIGSGTLQMTRCTRYIDPPDVQTGAFIFRCKER